MFAKHFLKINIILVFLTHIVNMDCVSKSKMYAEKNHAEYPCSCTSKFRQETAKQLENSALDNLDALKKKMEYMTETIDDMYKDIIIIKKNTKPISKETDEPSKDLFDNLQRRLTDIENENNQRNKAVNELNKRLDSMESAIQCIETKMNSISTQIKTEDSSLNQTKFQSKEKEIVKETSETVSTEEVLTSTTSTTTAAPSSTTTAAPSSTTTAAPSSTTTAAPSSTTTAAPPRIPTLCETCTYVPSTVQKNPFIWQYQQAPTRDELDNYVIKKTGCSYWPVSGNRNDPYRWVVGTIGDAAITQRVAVRTDQLTVIHIYWDGVLKYWIYAGQRNNQLTTLQQYMPDNLISSVSTPNLFSQDKYVPFYLTLDAERLRFGKECDSSDIFVHNIASTRGVQITTEFWLDSTYGGKVIVCPPLWPY